MNWFEVLDSEDQLLFQLWQHLLKTHAKWKLILYIRNKLERRVGKCTLEYFGYKNTEWMNDL